MDSDLADAVQGLKDIFRDRRIKAEWGASPPSQVDRLKQQYRIPLRYRNFLLAANPVSVETATPVERIRFIPADELEHAQVPFASNTEEWKRSWIVIAESALLGDPYFLDISKPDPEGDCPVYTAMSGQERWTPILAASSFAQFLRIVTVAMETANGYGDAIMDDEDEESFRETLSPRVKAIDPAAFRAGHWT